MKPIFKQNNISITPACFKIYSFYLHKLSLSDERISICHAAFINKSQSQMYVRDIEDGINIYYKSIMSILTTKQKV